MPLLFWNENKGRDVPDAGPFRSGSFTVYIRNWWLSLSCVVLVRQGVFPMIPVWIFVLKVEVFTCVCSSFGMKEPVVGLLSFCLFWRSFLTLNHGVQRFWKNVLKMSEKIPEVYGRTDVSLKLWWIADSDDTFRRAKVTFVLRCIDFVAFSLKMFFFM